MVVWVGRSFWVRRYEEPKESWDSSPAAAAEVAVGSAAREVLLRREWDRVERDEVGLRAVRKGRKEKTRSEHDRF